MALDGGVRGQSGAEARAVQTRGAAPSRLIHLLLNAVVKTVAQPWPPWQHPPAALPARDRDRLQIERKARHSVCAKVSGVESG